MGLSYVINPVVNGSRSFRPPRAPLGLWFYEFDLGAQGRTVSSLPPEVLPIHRGPVCRW